MEQGDCTFGIGFKMDLTIKARLVLDGHKNTNRIGYMYTGVASRDIVQFAFTYSASNGLNVSAANIINAYLQDP